MSGFVAEYSGVTNFGGTSTVVTLSSGVPAGDSLVAALVLQKSFAPMFYADAVDSRHNTWRFIRSINTTGTDTVTILMYAYVTSALNSGDSITFSYNGVSIDLAAVSVSHYNDPLTADVGAVGENTSATTFLITAATATTSDANELVIGAFGLESASRVFTATNGFTGLTKRFTTNGTGDKAIAPEYKYVSSTGTYTANGTLDVGSIYSGIVQTFKLSVPPDVRTARVKAWNGSAWVAHDTKAWNGSAWVRHRIKGRKPPTWLGPVASAGETVVTENFDYIGVGVPANVGNTRFAGAFTELTATMNGIAGLHGNAIRFNTDATPAHTEAILDFSPAMNQLYMRVYVRQASFPGSNLSIMTIRNSGGTALANLQLSTTGKLRVRNGNTLTATSTTTLTANQWVRIEWFYDGLIGRQDVRIFIGANLEGTTADEAITNQGAVVDSAASLITGIIVATPSITLDFDELAIDGDKWVESK